LRLLYGNYQLTVDDKNRLLVPAEIRKALDPATDGEAFFVVTGVNDKLWLYPERYYETLASRTRSELAPEEDLLAFDQANMAMACKVAWDRQGRVLIPEKVLRKANLGKEVVLAGVRDHAELWGRSDWQKREQELDERRAEIAVRAKQRHIGTQA
jgi:MraZ protein